jgi:hypothetical protein
MRLPALKIALSSFFEGDSTQFIVGGRPPFRSDAIETLALTKLPHPVDFASPDSIDEASNHTIGGDLEKALQSYAGRQEVAPGLYRLKEDVAEIP